jgi:hypothetical protein
MALLNNFSKAIFFVDVINKIDYDFSMCMVEKNHEA